MKVLALSAYRDPEPITSFMALAANDRFKRHSLTEDPDDADIILFVENSHYHDDLNFRVLKKHPLVARYREKAFMYNEHDRPWCVLPGLYFSMPAPFLDRSRQRACAIIEEANPLISFVEDATPDLLFSFVGARRNKVRDAVLELRHERGLITDTSAFNAYGARQATDRDARLRGYAEVMTRTKFVLSPKGVATSSLRPFEAMKAGRVPVIISDRYALPEGPDWDAFSIRIPEQNVAMIPRILEEREDEWSQMGMLARKAWEEWFAPDVLFHRMVESCNEIFGSRRLSEKLAQRLPQPLYVEWRARAILRPIRDRARGH